MKRISASQAKRTFSKVLDRAEREDATTIIQRRGKDAAAVISIRELTLLDRLMDRFEDEVLGERARTILANPELSETEALSEAMKRDTRD